MQPTDRIIGLTMRIQTEENYLEQRDVLAQDWYTLLSTALPGVKWISIPNLGGIESTEYCKNLGVNALILTGGDSIGATPLRDETEHNILKWAAELSLPVLGVCRGMQHMGVFSGCELISVKGHVGNRHGLIDKFNRQVNSFHNQALAKCPDEFCITGTALDGVIESIEHTERKWAGCMWHPEREPVPNFHDVKLLQRLFL